jgi:tetraacyldisaccharide 4'-kinase
MPPLFSIANLDPPTRMHATSATKTSQLAMSLQDSWYARAWWLQFLRPLSWIFRALVAIRAALYQRDGIPLQSAIPVVVVGNITVGGSGKTPLLIALAEELKRRGHRVGIVSRGYGGSSSQYPLRVTTETSSDHCGDEPAMLAKKLALPVVVDPKRTRAIALLANDKNYACDVILSDDGLQHYAMSRDIEIVVVDAARGFGNGLCLPAGPLREPLSRLKEVDFLVSNGEDSQRCLPLSYSFVPMTLEPVACVNMRSGERVATKDFFRKQMVHGVAAIGNPQRFFDSLRTMGSQVIEHPFPDHHRYTPRDLNFGDALPVIMTEKDAVKCHGFSLRNAWYVEVKVCLPASFLEAVIEKITTIQISRSVGVQRNLFEQ